MSFEVSKCQSFEQTEQNDKGEKNEQNVAAERRKEKAHPIKVSGPNATDTIAIAVHTMVAASTLF